MLHVSFFRRISHRAFALGTVLACSLGLLSAQTAPITDGFATEVNGSVFAVLAQPDGKLLVAGQFSTVGSFARSNLARINPDGSLDESFNPNVNGAVRALLLQPDGRIVIGGDFTTVQPGATGTAVTRNRIARLNANGTLDTGFNPNLGGTLQPQVHALLLQPDGRIVAGGTFTTVQPPGSATAVTRNRLARFNADGSLDSAFNPNANAIVMALALHVDGKILVGGGFTTLHAAQDAQPTTRNRIARLNPNGTLDSEFNPNANNGVTSIAVQRDGKILFGGHFTQIQPIGDENPANRSRLARLNTNGTLDSEFFPSVNGSVYEIAIQPDGRLLVGGTFNTAWSRGALSVSRVNFARFNTDGSIDADFSPGFNAQVESIAFQPDGKVVVGGLFTGVLPAGASTSIPRRRLARLNADGSFDADFELGAGGRVLVSAVQSDGRVLIGGTFTNIGGETHNYLARLNADGSVDSAYRPNLNGAVYTMTLQPDGKALIGGAFTTIGGENRRAIARMNPNGTIDSEFYPEVEGQVGVILLQPDGRILVGGTFSFVRAVRATESTLRTNLLRLNADGTLDPSFDPSPNSSVAALALQSDGKILVGGSFSGFTPNGANSLTPRNFFARINSDGTLDTAFSPALNGRVSALAVQSDQKVVVAGAFTAVRGSNATEQTDRNRIARFNSDGTVDPAYNPNANGNVLALALQSDGRLIIGGAFTTLQPNDAPDWTLRKYAARLNVDGTVDPAFNLDISEAPGNRVDSLRLLGDGRLLIGGSFTSLHPAGTPARIDRRNFARLNANLSVDTGFAPGAGGSPQNQINAFALQADNRIIAVGSFTDLGGAQTTNIARFNPEGGADTTFSPTVASDGAIRAVAIRPEAAVTPSSAAGFAWLNRDGSLRPAFVPGGARLSGQVNVAAVQANGGVLLGGAFSNLANTTGGNLVRFNANGSLDPNFNPSPNGAVSGIAIQPDGRIIITGSFTTVGGTIRNRIARLNGDGSLDAAFDPSASGNINALILEGDGRMIVGGAFTTFTPNAATTSVARNYLARLNADGTVDANYNPNLTGTVNALALQSDGKIIAGGGFTTAQPNNATTATVRNYLARFNTDGTLDTNFDPNANNEVRALAVQPNGQIVLGGYFTSLQPAVTSTLATRNYVARINSDGAVDAAFTPEVNAPVHAIAIQSDGGILLAGEFTTVRSGGAAAAVARNRLARVNSDGTLDATFNPDPNGNVTGVAVRPDGTLLITGSFTGLQLQGSIVVGGSFGTLGGIGARNLAALTSTGSVSTSFQPNPNGVVNALLGQPDGKLLVGGAFTTIAGQSRSRIARFNTDGTLDSTFNPALGGPVNVLAMQADGRILVGGALGGASNLIRLNANGSPDATFAPGVAAPVTALAVAQASGKIIYVTSGSALRRLNANGSPDATAINAPERAGAYQTLAVQADGSIVVGGEATITAGGASRAYVARFLADGSLDGSFRPEPNGAVTAVAVQSDGRIMIGGRFTVVGGATRHSLARLPASQAAPQSLGVTSDRRTVVWARGGSAAEVSAVAFDLSTDQLAWTPLGGGVPAGNAWTLGGQSLPASGVFYIRVRAIAPSSGGAASGVIQAVREFNYASAAFAPVIGAAAPAGGFTVHPFTGIVSGTPPAPGRAGNVAIISDTGETIEIVAASPQLDGTDAQLANLSTRGRVTPGNPLILGFAVAGSEPRALLVRAIGPALAGFGVAEALAGTRLQIHDSAGALIVANEGWTAGAEIAGATARTGAFPLVAGSADSAALVTLAPGVYTMQVLDPSGAGGVALGEIYDAGSGDGSRLVNVSSRGEAGAGGAALISGFVISGDAAKRVLLRAVGPTLALFGAPSVVADPAISLFDHQGHALGTNDNWVSHMPQLAAAARSAGAFALEPGSKDAAVIATLPPGVYTVQVSAGATSTGTALLEVYELP